MKTIASKILARVGLVAVILLPISASAADRHHDQRNHRGQLSGISGQAVSSPNVRVDGVILEGSPIQTSVAVYTAKGKLVATLDTDAEGVFEVVLKPGSYVLVPYGVSNPFLIAVETAVTVRKGDFTVVTVGYFNPPL